MYPQKGEQLPGSPQLRSTTHSPPSEGESLVHLKRASSVADRSETLLVLHAVLMAAIQQLQRYCRVAE